jgi:signal transduction histidine kinase
MGLRRVFSSLRLRTRLALVMFLTMISTGAILSFTYAYHASLIEQYVGAQASELVTISQLAQRKIPPHTDQNDVLQQYKQALEDAKLSNITIASPSGEVVAASNPKQVGHKIKNWKRRFEAKKDPIQISAEFSDINVDPDAPQTSFVVTFPIVQGDKVIGYAQVTGKSDEVSTLLKHYYAGRFAWVLAIMLAGLGALVYLASRFTRPVDELVTGAQQVAKGNLYVTLPVEGGDEMGRLAQTFNQMVERLRENRKLEERLYEAQKMSLLGRFAATVAHEVRNSLNFINLSIDQIRARNRAGDERSRELERNVANVKDEINRLNSLVNDFLAAGRQSPPSFADCDVRATVEEAVALVEKQARLQSISVSTDLPAELPALQADAAQLKTCFLNILTNAVQAMPGGGRITVSARLLGKNGDSGRLELRFADTGPGIRHEDRDKIFAPYFSTKATGFGLGLAITKKIVEDHGGRIYVTSGETQGTVMAMELPVSRPVPEPVAAV